MKTGSAVAHPFFELRAALFGSTRIYLGPKSLVQSHILGTNRKFIKYQWLTQIYATICLRCLLWHADEEEFVSRNYFDFDSDGISFFGDGWNGASNGVIQGLTRDGLNRFMIMPAVEEMRKEFVIFLKATLLH